MPAKRRPAPTPPRKAAAPAPSTRRRTAPVPPMPPTDNPIFAPGPTLPAPRRRR